MDHAERLSLADEVHARPPAEVDTPATVTYVALMMNADERPREAEALAALCERFHVPPPSAAMTQFSAKFGTSTFKWERHGEFSSLMLIQSEAGASPFSAPLISALPEEWWANLPGRTIAAARAELLRCGAEAPDPSQLGQYFEGNAVIGAEIGDGAGYAFTDFRIHVDGCTRFLVFDRSLTRRQAGRMIQRLFEIEAYRVMALLALPVARRQAPRILAIETALAALTENMAGGEAHDDGRDETLLGELSRLAAEVESSLAASQYRFGAGRAYHELVRTRIAELREKRIGGTQTMDEFMARRLAPAMATCVSVSRRMRDLSERVARASALLSTRVDITRERQNQALLASMERRARLQLRLQQTVEGLSIAAITYYVTGLIGYAAKALKAAGLHVDPDLVAGIAIPVVAVLAAVVMHQVRRRLVVTDGGHSAVEP
jgi:uncharacterized membrane-anchored protein